MKKLLRHTMLFLTVSALLLAGGTAVYASQVKVSISTLDTAARAVRSKVATNANSTSQTSQSEKAGKASFSSWFFQPFKGGTGAAQSDKVLSNVKVFPNPSGETLSLSFRIGKRAEVSVKIMDALGNELYSLFNQTLDAGIQSHSLEIPQKLSPGFYFVRVSSGTETIVKRISIF